MRLLSEADVRSMIDPEAAIASSAQAYVALAEGTAQIPPRTEILTPEVGGVIFFMPGIFQDRIFGLKLIALRDGAEDQLSVSTVLLFDARTLQPLGLVASEFLTDYRTAAGIAAATRSLARPEARVHAVYGAGRLAGPSVQLVARVRPVERVLIVGRSAARRDRLIAELQADPALRHCRIEAAEPDTAAAEADIVTTVTTSPAPVFDGSRLRPGTHVNLGGAFRPDTREVDDHVARRGRYFYDAPVCLDRAGDLVLPLASGTLEPARLGGAIGAVLAGRAPGRRDATEITVFKSLGTAAQDLLLAADLLQTAARDDLGQPFDLRGPAGPGREA